MVRLTCHMYNLPRVLEVLQGGRDVEGSPSPELVTVVGRDDD